VRHVVMRKISRGPLALKPAQVGWILKWPKSQLSKPILSYKKYIQLYYVLLLHINITCDVIRYTGGLRKLFNFESWYRENWFKEFLAVKQPINSSVTSRKTHLFTICWTGLIQFTFEISSSHVGEYDVQNCLLECTAV
jgi:hypothetical protein